MPLFSSIISSLYFTLSLRSPFLCSQLSTRRATYHGQTMLARRRIPDASEGKLRACVSIYSVRISSGACGMLPGNDATETFWISNPSEPSPEQLNSSSTFRFHPTGNSGDALVAISGISSWSSCQDSLLRQRVAIITIILKNICGYPSFTLHASWKYAIGGT